MKYEVDIEYEATFEKTVPVDADSAEEAKAMAFEMLEDMGLTTEGKGNFDNIEPGDVTCFARQVE